MNQKRVLELFEYRDGSLFRRVRCGNRPAGERVGSRNLGDGRLRVVVDGRSWLVHRLIYLYHYGEIPVYLDHIDRNPLNNKIENLRPATRNQNCHNSSRRADNRTGFKGVGVHSGGKYQARIRFNGERYHLGLFNTPEEASEAYCEKAKLLHGEFYCEG